MNEIKIKSGSNKHKSWVAKLELTENNNIKRIFVNHYEVDGFYNDRVYHISDGVYHISDGGTEEYCLIENDINKKIQKNQINQYL